VVLIDELAHTNVPGSRNPKRYQDVQEILAAGIHVITTLNVQHLESLYNTVEQLIGVKVRERLPDSVLAEADQIVNIDLAAEDLQKRLQEGKIYPRERIAAALENFFTASNLEHLRELTLRETASQLDLKRREIKANADGNAPDQIMVCLSSRGPNSARLLRFASRLAGRLNRNWYAVYVQTPSEEPTVIDATTQRLLADTLTLANQLGAMVFTFKGQDIPDTILRFAKEYRVGQIVIGKPRTIPLWKKMLGHRSVAEQLIHRAKGVTVVVVDAEADEKLPGDIAETAVDSPTAPLEPRRATGPVGGMLTPGRIVIWDHPVSKQDILERMVAAIRAEGVKVDASSVVNRLREREERGSTFLNEGVALPHARIDELEAPQIVLGLTHAGVLDAPTDVPIDVVFMLLSPAKDATAHLKVLAKAGRLLQGRELRRALKKASSPDDVLDRITQFESEAGAIPQATQTPAAAGSKAQ